MPSYVIGAQDASATPTPPAPPVVVSLAPLRVYVGDTWTVRMALVDPAGNPIDLTGAVVGVNFWPSDSAAPVDLAAAGGGLKVLSYNPAVIALVVPPIVTAQIQSQPDYRTDYPTRAQCFMVDTLGVKQTFEIIPFQPLAPRLTSLPLPVIGTIQVALQFQGPAGPASKLHTFQITIANTGQTRIPLPVPPIDPTSIRLLVNGWTYTAPELSADDTAVTWANPDFVLEPSDRVILSYF